MAAKQTPCPAPAMVIMVLLSMTLLLLDVPAKFIRSGRENPRLQPWDESTF